MKNKSFSNSPKLREVKEGRKNALKRKIIIFLFVVLLIFTGLVFLSNWKEINIQNVQISGNKVILTEDIEKIVLNNLQGKYLYIIPKSNGLLYPKKRILDQINANHKRIKEINIDTHDFKTLEITLTENTAKYTWCGETPAPTAEDILQKCYFMNDEGYVFDTAPYFSGNVYLKFYGVVKTTEHSPIGYYFAPKKFNNLIKFYETLTAMNLDTDFFYLKDNGDTEIHLYKDTSATERPVIFYKTDDNIDHVIENLKSSVFVDPLKSRIEKEYPSLLYIDLRFDNKVYYKFK